MSNPVNQLDALLRQHQFQLVRQGKHLVYRNPEGKVYVTAATPSDFRAAKNALTVLKHVIASPAIPEVLAISEFERQQAADKIAAQEKKNLRTGGSGPAKTQGTGYSYIDKPVKEIISTRSPEEKQYEKDLRQWEARVREERRQFVDDAVQKAKPWLAKLYEENERLRQVFIDRYQKYADTRLKKDVERYRRALDVYQASDAPDKDNDLTAAFGACSVLFGDIVAQLTKTVISPAWRATFQIG